MLLTAVLTVRFCSATSEPVIRMATAGFAAPPVAEAAPGMLPGMVRGGQGRRLLQQPEGTASLDQPGDAQADSAPETLPGGAGPEPLDPAEPPAAEDMLPGLVGPMTRAP